MALLPLPLRLTKFRPPAPIVTPSTSRMVLPVLPVFVVSVLLDPPTLIDPAPVAVNGLPVVVATSRLPPLKSTSAVPLLPVSVTPLLVVVVSDTDGLLNVTVPLLQLLTMMPLLPEVAVMLPVWKVIAPHAADAALLTLTVRTVLVVMAPE